MITVIALRVGARRLPAGTSPPPGAGVAAA
jgi:hypothetical protein